MSRPPKSVECPVCKRSFISWMISGHVEECLSESSAKEHNVSETKMKDDLKMNSHSLHSAKTPTSSVNTGPPSKKAKLENPTLLRQSPQTKGNIIRNNSFVPLAEKLRPKTLAEYVGQTQVVGDKCILRNLLGADEIPSVIFWGPPGCGKVNFQTVTLFSFILDPSHMFVHFMNSSICPPTYQFIYFFLNRQPLQTS